MELLQSQKSSFSVLPWLEGLMYQNNYSHNVPFEKKDLFKSVEKSKVVEVKKNMRLLSSVIHLKVIALSFFDFLLGIYLLHYIIFQY